MTTTPEALASDARAESDLRDWVLGKAWEARNGDAAWQVDQHAHLALTWAHTASRRVAGHISYGKPAQIPAEIILQAAILLLEDIREHASEQETA